MGNLRIFRAGLYFASVILSGALTGLLLPLPSGAWKQAPPLPPERWTSSALNRYRSSIESNIYFEIRKARGEYSVRAIGMRGNPTAEKSLEESLDKRGGTLAGIVHPYDQLHYKGQWDLHVRCHSKEQSGKCEICSTHRRFPDDKESTHWISEGLSISSLARNNTRLVHWMTNINGPSDAGLPFADMMVEIPVNQESESDFYGYDLDKKLWLKKGTIAWKMNSANGWCQKP